MFGFLKGAPPPQQPGSFAEVATQQMQNPQGNAAAGGAGKQGGGGGGFGNSFDPSGLERAAKAARELDTSTNAKEALEIIKQQEKTSQMEHQARMKEMEAQMKVLEIKRVEKEAEERRKTIELETSHYNYRAQQQDELARKRQQEQIAAQKALQEEQLRRQEESLAKQEAMRRQTLEYENKLRKEAEQAKALAEAEGRIRQERENADIHYQEIKIKAAEQRETVLQTIKTASDVIGRGFTEFVTDGDKMFATITGLTLLAAGVYGARSATSVAGRFIEARIGKPSLVRETSRRSPLAPFLHPWNTMKRGFNTWFGKKPEVLEGIVLAPEEEERLRAVAWSSINARKNRAPLRNLMLYGPPGTGKTMFAKRLALNSGMDFAIMTGGDVLPLGKTAVSEIHKIFDWAQTNRKGTVIFVDETDAFLRQRDRTAISEEMRAALNAFLYRTGESSNKFMLVLASNTPEQLDSAIQDRVDELVAFKLPGVNERLRIIKQYFDTYVRKHHEKTGANPINTSEITDSELEQVAANTEGFSGRELSKLCIALQANAYASAQNAVTREMLHKTVESYKKQHQQKTVWLKQN